MATELSISEELRGDHANLLQMVCVKGRLSLWLTTLNAAVNIFAAVIPFSWLYYIFYTCHS